MDGLRHRKCRQVLEGYYPSRYFSSVHRSPIIATWNTRSNSSIYHHGGAWWPGDKVAWEPASQALRMNSNKTRCMLQNPSVRSRWENITDLALRECKRRGQEINSFQRMTGARVEYDFHQFASNQTRIELKYPMPEMMKVMPNEEFMASTCERPTDIPSAICDRATSHSKTSETQLDMLAFEEMHGYASEQVVLVDTFACTISRYRYSASSIASKIVWPYRAQDTTKACASNYNTQVAFHED